MARAWRSVPAAVVLAALGPVLAPSAAAAAACATDDVAELASRADVAFVGTVTDRRGEIARLRVSDVYAGSPGSVVVVDGRDPASPVAWQDERQYLVLARTTDGDLTTTRCDGTREVSDEALAAAQSALGPATPLGRGTAEPTPAPSPSASPTTSAPDTAPASEGRDTGTSRLALGIGVGAVLVASFFLPQLRRHNRERRRARDDGDA
ncbi:hypothetical protein [Solicola sp. PLA-1-18]|uniref:hypothetical protein n=1 Tax=Solicola sp. PLA-1-18 TaxID=3380532 RepID=UPI003B7C9772